MNPDGTGQRQVSAELSAVSDFAVAPDGRSLVVADGAVLVELRADGSDRRQLTESGRFEYDPAYSPDSTVLAFGRADAETGEGLGLWTRRPLGGDQQRIELPAELRPGTSPSPSASDEPAALLRAPRFSPDGAALAFVDSAGRVAVLELPAARLTSAAFGAVSVPVWLPDSTGLLVAGLPDRAAPSPAEPGPLPRLDADAIGLAADDLDDVRVVRLDRGASQVDIPAYPAGAARVAVDPDGRRAIVVAGDGLPDAGGLMSITSAAGNAALPVLRDGGPAVVDVAAGPAAGEFLVVRTADGATTDLPAGIWRVEAASGGGEPLLLDGRLPRWLP
jgi:dipeptidyl aminopeptidase/acylaminoacyl peptidase